MRFVLLHGAFHGGWCWARVARLLRARGHEVTTPTQTGLGERRGALSRDIDMARFVDDLVDHLFFEDLREAVVVGHSFAGCTLSGAAPRARDRIAALIFLDGVLPESGERPFDAFPPKTEPTRRALAEAHDGGVSVPAPEPSVFGVFDPADAAWVASRMTPHPLSAYATPVAFDGPPGAGLPLAYVRCTDPVYRPLEISHARARARGWPVHDLAAGHDAMVTAPRETADLIERLAAALVARGTDRGRGQ